MMRAGARREEEGGTGAREEASARRIEGRAPPLASAHRLEGPAATPRGRGRGAGRLGGFLLKKKKRGVHWTRRANPPPPGRRRAGDGRRAGRKTQGLALEKISRQGTRSHARVAHTAAALRFKFFAGGEREIESKKGGRGAKKRHAQTSLGDRRSTDGARARAAAAQPAGRPRATPPDRRALRSQPRPARADRTPPDHSRASCAAERGSAGSCSAAPTCAMYCTNLARISGSVP